MKMKALLLTTLLASPAYAQTYDIDGSHTAAQFSVRHLMVSNVKGEFTKTSGTVVYDPKNVANSKVEATVDVNSVNTRVEKRDADLKGDEFFNAKTFPTMKFVSTKVEQNGVGKLKVTGNLTIRDVTKEVVLDVDGPTEEIKDPWGNARRGASATTKINRQDFGLKYNKLLETGGLAVGNDVAITIDLEMTAKKAG